jgi:hypothetical protein
MSVETTPISDLRQRKQSVGAIQIIDKSGQKHTVHLDELTEADRELAEKFGYQPVRAFPEVKLIYECILTFASNRCSSANLDTWLPSLLLSVSVGCSRRSPLLISIVSNLYASRGRKMLGLTLQSSGSWWNQVHFRSTLL